MGAFATSTSDSVDPYLDPATGVLANLVQARTADALINAEGELCFRRMVQIWDRPVQKTGDLEELCAIHFHLFQDVYEWAGTPRVIDLRNDLRGGHFFMSASLIERSANYIAEELEADNMLRGLSQERFIARLSHYYEQVDHLHPFRTGNGRTQRVLWSRVAKDAGWYIDWYRVSALENQQALQVAVERGDLKPLCKMFEQIVFEIDKNSRRS